MRDNLKDLLRDARGFVEDCVPRRESDGFSTEHPRRLIRQIDDALLAADDAPADAR